MTAALQDVFADTGFWVALVIKQDQHHLRAQQWSLQVGGRIITTAAVVLETSNMLARPAWRGHAVALIDNLRQRPDVSIVALSPDLWNRGWELYRDRPDKGWSLTDCISFLVMEDSNLQDALTPDEHFRQAGFRALMLQEP
jgi:predicted nucleic acid-binding protein